MQSDYQSNCVRQTYISLILGGLFLFIAQPVLAQTPDAHPPDFQQMQKKIEQLEQELHDLKQQVAAAAPTTGSDSK